MSQQTLRIRQPSQQRRAWTLKLCPPTENVHSNVQAVALQQGTCEKGTDKVSPLRCATHVVVCAVQIKKV
jgi:hypothetical protein